MLIKHNRSHALARIMDPDCAVCSQPALVQCECEATALDVALRQAEQRMMATLYTDIRTWVRAHAQDYILSYFSMLTSRRKDAHASHIRRITERAAYYYRAPPHPSEIAAADAELKRGIDEDWKASVQRYPEVLEYFYGLVRLNLPREEDAAVRDPPLSALGGSAAKKVRLKEPEKRRSGHGHGGKEREKQRERERRVPPVTPPSGGRRRPAAAFAPPGPGYAYVS